MQPASIGPCNPNTLHGPLYTEDGHRILPREVGNQQSTQRHSVEDLNRHQHRYENLKVSRNCLGQNNTLRALTQEVTL